MAEEEDSGMYTWDSLIPRAGESQGGTTITVAPKAAIHSIPFPERSPSRSPVAAELPPSTAPARLPEPGQKRKKAPTNRYTKGRQADIIRSQGHSQ